jgi:hypothetical protein
MNPFLSNLFFKVIENSTVVALPTTTSLLIGLAAFIIAGIRSGSVESGREVLPMIRSIEFTTSKVVIVPTVTVCMVAIEIVCPTLVLLLKALSTLSIVTLYGVPLWHFREVQEMSA